MRDRSPKYLVDKDLGPELARVLRALGLDAHHLLELGFVEKTPDEEWMSAIGEEGRCFISRDLGIRNNPVLRAALKRHQVGAFFLSGHHLASRELIEQAVAANRMIEEKAMNARKPFIFIVRRGGRKLIPVPLD